ncbi:uncharacterized protein AB675_4482 [Cyphellophora attinorum]|uniref:FAD-binding domain-containing protein n=1 Tax=Cyphellophora attinorum TaxID=1664694 RepID=A0A0N1H304_9EURO|nr:uncharacterized protein AB675_4482 [Phialophora attinorum]KPI39070.1 hypothetical protein AB675_4482 [Phialophora attinorum]
MEPIPEKLRVLIVGAGIAGCASAYFLAKQGHSVTVIERHPGLRTNGLQLDLRGHGIEVMKLMGLEAAVRAQCVPEEGVALVDATGKRRAFFAANKTGKGAQSMTSEFEIMRGDLCRLLCEAADNVGAVFKYGVGVEAYMEMGKEVEVRLTDGRVEKVDLLVGCDGLASRVRRLMDGAGTIIEGKKDTALEEMAEKIAYFTMEEPQQEGEQWIMQGCVFPGGKKLGTRRHHENRIQMYLMWDERPGAGGPLDKIKRGDVKAEKAAFADLYRGEGWRANDAVKELETGAEDFYCQHTGVVKLDKWSRGRVTLVGDAGYGHPPDGYGTSCALVGAYVLGGEIEKEFRQTSSTESKESLAKNQDPLLAALESYEEVFGPHMKSIVNSYSAAPSMFDNIPWNGFTIGLMYRVMGTVAYLGLDKLAMKFMPADSGKWKLPVYDTVVDAS